LSGLRGRSTTTKGAADVAQEDLISHQAMHDRVERAFATWRFMTRLGWIVLSLAVTGLLVTIVLWLHGDITLEQTMASAFGVIISSILSGAASYSSGINIGLGASRLALALEKDEAGR
jgi:hypothetical protein